MENTPVSTVRDLLIPDVDTISPDDTVMSARRRMESQTIRSLVVVESDRPIGVVRWRALGQADNATPIREVMQTDVPTFNVDTTVDSLGDVLAGSDVDFDRFPVVDENGVLIGEVPRAAVTKRGVITDETTRPLQSMSEADEASSAPALHVEQGMNVIGPDDDKIGTVDQVEVNHEGAISGFTVKHGLFGRHAKRLPVDVIIGTRDNDLLVTIGSLEFKMLADIDS